MMWTGLDLESFIEQQILGLIDEDMSDDRLREIKSDVIARLCNSDYFGDLVNEIIEQETREGEE